MQLKIGGVQKNQIAGVFYSHLGCVVVPMCVLCVVCYVLGWVVCWVLGCVVLSCQCDINPPSVSFNNLFLAGLQQIPMSLK